MAAGGHPVEGGLHQGPYLHGVETRLDHAETHPACPEHRVELVPDLGRLVEPLLLGRQPDRCLLDRHLLGVGEELVEGRVEQPDGHGQPVHRLEDLHEIEALGHPQGLERRLLLDRGRGQDHLAHDGQTVLGEEHVLGPAQPDPFGAVQAGVGGVGPVVRIGPDPEVPGPDLVGPAQDGLELRRGRTGRNRDLADHHRAVGAVHRDPVPFVDHGVPHRERRTRDAQCLGAHDGGLAPPAGHHGGMAHQSAPGGEDALCRQHAVHVLRRGLAAHQDHWLTTLGRGLGVVGSEVDTAHRSTRGRAEAPDQHVVAGFGELGMEDLLEVLAGDPSHRLFLSQANGPLIDHVDRHPQGGPPGPLAHPRLEHPQLALVDGELGVAHVAVVGLEAGEDGQELAVDLGELVLERGQRLGIADAGHHVLALGVDQEVAVLPHLASGRVACEADPGSRVVVPVAEHHGLHVDGRSQVVGDPLADPVGDGTRAVPRREHRLDRATELLVGILGERLAGVALHDLLIGVDQIVQELDGDAGVGGGPR